MDEQQKAHLLTGQVAAAVESLRKYGVDPAPLCNAMAGDIASIDRLSRGLLSPALNYQSARVRREQSRASKSKSGTVTEEIHQSMGLVRGEGLLPPSVVSFVITLMIEACAREGVAPPTTLAQLARVHLGADTFAAQELKAPRAFDKAAHYKLAYPDATQDEIARYAGVSRPRVSQWIKDGDLDRAVELRRRLIGAEELARDTTPRM